MDHETIGLEAILEDSQFTAGVVRYVDGLSTMQAETVRVMGQLNGAEPIVVEAVMQDEQLVEGLEEVVGGIEDVEEAGMAMGPAVEKSVDKIPSQMKKAAEGADAFGTSLGGLAKRLVQLGLMSMGIKALAKAFSFLTDTVTASNSEFERYQTQLSVLLGGMDEAEARIATLGEFGRATPFELPGIMQAEKVLLSFGLVADDVQDRVGKDAMEIRTILGDVAAGAGIAFEDMAKIMGRFSAGSTGEAIMRLQELGVVTKTELSAMGVEFDKAGKLLTPINEATSVLLQTMETKFGGMMVAQSKTFEGMQSNMEDWIWEAKRILAQPIFDQLSAGMAELLVYLDRPETWAAIESGARGVAQGISTVIDVLKPVVGYLTAVEPEAIKAGLGMSALGLALPIVAGGITAINTAMAFLALNPIVVAAAAVVGIGIGLVAVIDKIEKSEQAIASFSQTALNSTSSYDAYIQKVTDLYREEKKLGDGWADAQIQEGLFRDGMAMTEEQYKKNSDLVASGYVPSMQAAAEAALAGAENQTIATASLEAGSAAVDAYAARYQGLADAVAAVAEPLQAVFSPDFYAEQLGAMADITSDYADQTEETAQAHADSMADIELDQLVSSGEMEAEYEAEHQALLDAGMTEDAEKLSIAHDGEVAENDYNFSKQLQMQQIANVKKQMDQERAYISALGAQKDASRKAMIEQIKAARAEGKISEAQEKELLAIAEVGASERLLNDLKAADEATKISEAIATGQVASAETGWKALQDIQEGNLAGAQARLDQLAIDRQKLMDDLLDNSAFSGAGFVGGDYGGGGGGGAASAAREATEPATQALRDVANDIRDAIEAIREALANAPNVIWDASTENAFENVGDAVKGAVSAVYAWMEYTPEDSGKSVGEMIKDVGKYLEPMSSLFKLLKVDTAGWRTDSEFARDEVLALIVNMKYVSSELYDWLSKMPEAAREGLADAGTTAGELQAIFKLLDVDMSKLVPQGAGWTDNVLTWISQMKFLSGEIYTWLTTMAPEARSELMVASGIAKDLQGLFTVLGTDLTKIKTGSGDFREKVDLWYAQMRYLSGTIFTWMTTMEHEARLALGGAAETAKSVKELFAVLGADLEKATPVKYRFAEKVEAWFGQARMLSGKIYYWMVEIQDDATLNVAQAAETAKAVKALFDILDIDLNALVPVGGVMWAGSITAYFDQLKFIGVQIMDWLGYRDLPTQAQIAATAAVANNVKDMFELFDIELGNNRPMGDRRMADVVQWFEDLKYVFEQIMPLITEMETDLGADLVRVGGFVEQLVSMFERINDAAVAIDSAGSLGGIHLATAYGLLNQIYGIMTYINALATVPGSLELGDIAVQGADNPSQIPDFGNMNDAVAMVSVLAHAMRLGMQQGSADLTVQIADAVGAALAESTINVQVQWPGRGDIAMIH